jgi:hypothetical protein
MRNKPQQPKEKAVTQTAELLAEDWGTVLPFVGFTMDNPQLWEQYEGEWVQHPHETDDVYQLLDHYRFTNQVNDLTGSSNPKPKPHAIAIITTGWGAPITDCDPDNPNSVAPSQSPRKRRIALCVIVARDASSCSVLRFEDDPEGITTDRMGTGTLAKEIDSAAFFVWGAEFVARLMVTAERTKSDNETSPELLRALPLLGLMADDTNGDTGAVSDRLEASLRSFLGMNE